MCDYVLPCFGACVFCLQKLRLQQSRYGVAAAFLFVITPYPPAAYKRKQQIANWPFPLFLRKPVIESPLASGYNSIFSALTGRYHPARH